MRITTSKSKIAEPFYISKGYVNDKGASTSVIVRKPGPLKELLPEHGPTASAYSILPSIAGGIRVFIQKRIKMPLSCV